MRLQTYAGQKYQQDFEGKMYSSRWRKDRTCTWQQGDLVFAGQESLECFVSIYDVGIRCIYLSLTLGTTKFKQLNE